MPQLLVPNTRTGINTIKKRTVQTTTVTLSPMLMAALLFCADPVVPRATIAKMRAGMEQVRQRRDAPVQSSVMMENTSAHTAIPE